MGNLCLPGGYSNDLFLNWKNLFYQYETAHVTACTLYPLSSPCGFSLCPLCSHCLSSRILLSWGLSEISFLHSEKTWPLWSSAVGQLLQPFDHLYGPPLGSLQTIHACLEPHGPELFTVLQVWPDQHRVGWDDHTSVSAWCPQGCSPGSDLPSLLQQSTASSCSAWCPPGLPSPLQQGWALGTCPRCRTSHFSLVQVHCSCSPTLPACPRLHVLTPDVSASSASAVPAANLLRVLSMLSSRSSMKVLSSMGPTTSPWGTPLVTGCQPV